LNYTRKTVFQEQPALRTWILE